MHRPPIHWTPVFNIETAEAVPPFGMMELCSENGSGLDSNGNAYVRKPASSSAACLINGPAPIGARRAGQGHRTYPAIVAHDPSGIVPAPGETWGPYGWFLSRKGRGYRVIGDSQGGYTNVTEEGHQPGIAIVQLYTATLPAYTRSGDVITCTSNGTVEVEGRTLGAGTTFLYNPGINSDLAADAGLYACTQSGGASTPAKFRRTGDPLRCGLLVEVIDGQPQSGYAASVTIVGGAITAAGIITGELYSSEPQIRFVGGGGTGAKAHGTINGDGELTGVVIDAGGSGYSTTPTLSIDGLLLPATIHTRRATFWGLITDDPITPNTTELVFRRFPQPVFKTVDIGTDLTELDIEDADVVILNSTADEHGRPYRIHGITHGRLWNGRRVELRTFGVDVLLHVESPEATGDQFVRGLDTSPHGTSHNAWLLRRGHSLFLTAFIQSGGSFAHVARWQVEGVPHVLVHDAANALSWDWIYDPFGSGAEFTVHIVDGEIDSIDVDDGGTDYFGPYGVSALITGDGEGALITLEIDESGVITGVVVDDGGSDYTEAEVVVYFPGSAAIPDRDGVIGPTIYRYDIDGNNLTSTAYGVRRPQPEHYQNGPRYNFNYYGCDYMGIQPQFTPPDGLTPGNGWLILGGLVIAVGDIISVDYLSQIVEILRDEIAEAVEDVAYGPGLGNSSGGDVATFVDGDGQTLEASWLNVTDSTATLTSATTDPAAFVATGSDTGGVSSFSAENSTDGTGAGLAVYGTTEGGTGLFGLDRSGSAQLTFSPFAGQITAIGSWNNTDLVFGADNTEQLRLVAGGPVQVTGDEEVSGGLTADTLAADTSLRVGSATTADATADTLLATSATTQKALVLQRQSGQTADLFQTQMHDGTVTSYASHSGRYWGFNTTHDAATVSIRADTGVPCLHFWTAADALALSVRATGQFVFEIPGSNGFCFSGNTVYGTLQNDSGDLFSLGYSASPTSLGTSVIQWNSASPNVRIASTSASNVVLVVKGTTSQSGDLFQGQDVSANVLTKVSAKGNISQAIGSTTSLMTGLGVADAQTSASGVGNTAATTDDTLFTYSLPTNSMSANGKSIRAVASGTTAANGNDKAIKFWFAGVAMVVTGTITPNAKTWIAEMEVTRVDATHVSIWGRITVDGTGVYVNTSPNVAVSDLTANASVIKVTGASVTTGAANDVLGYFQRTDFAN